MPPTEDDLFVQTFKQDEYFRRFLDGSLEGTQKIITQTMTVSDQLNKLTEGIALVDAEIQRLILGKHEDLLSQATWIEKLEGVLDMMSSHIQSLLAGVERVRNRITEPYIKIDTKIQILRRVWETIDLLRHTSRIQIVSKRLNHLMENDKEDLLKLSENIRELSELWDEMDLTTIEILAPELQGLKTAKRDVGKRAKKLLLTGLQSQKPNLVSQSVEVLHNLNSLVTIVGEITKTCKDNLEQMMRDNLDPKMLTESGEKNQKNRTQATTQSSSTLFRPRLWSNLEKLFDAIYENSVQIEALEIALRKPRSDLIGAKTKQFIDDFPNDKKTVANSFWILVTDCLSRFLVKYAGDSVLFKQALEGEYPRFLRLYIDLCKRLQNTKKPDSFSNPFEMNKKVISSFEKSYLSKSVSMVLDPVHNMFSKKGVPETEEVDLLIRTIRSELIVALFDPNLSSTIARNITKAVRLFCSNCDNIVDRSPEATQVIGPRKRVQDENIAVANITEYLKTMLQNVMSNLKTDSEATMIVSLSLADADNLIAGILNPVLNSVENAIHAILLTMHKEDFSKETVSKVSTSLYMRELQEFITRAYGTYLKPFESEDIVRRCCSATGQRCVQLFMRHVSILRPLGSHGRAKLFADCNQLEAAVAPLLGDEPKTYRILRSFRSLLTQSAQEILTNPVIGETIPCSLVLFYLFSFGPDEMKSPHKSGVNWSPEELSSWMDSHENERDRLALVSGALGRYSNLVSKQSGKNFDPVYGVMAELIQRHQ